MYAEVITGLVLGIIGFGEARLRPAAVVIGLGSLLSIAAAPLDNIWHAIFGVDFTIWSLPHIVGIVYGGAVSLIGLLAWWMTLERFAPDRPARTTARLALVIQVAALLPWLLFILMEYEHTLVMRISLLAYRWDLQAAYYPVFIAYLSFGMAIAIVRAIGPAVFIAGTVAAYLLLLALSQALQGAMPLASPVPLFISLAALPAVTHRLRGIIGDVTACLVAVPLLYLNLALAARPVPHDLVAVAGTTAAAAAAALAGHFLGRGLHTLSGS